MTSLQRVKTVFGGLMMLAGAAAVEIGAANLRDPYACRDIVDALPDALAGRDA